jgi:hypothetical protein
MLYEKLCKICHDMHLAELHDNDARKEFGDAYHEHAKAMEYSFICHASNEDELFKNAMNLEREALTKFAHASSRLSASNYALMVSRDRFAWLVSCGNDDSSKSNFTGFLEAFSKYEACPCNMHLNRVVMHHVGGWKSIEDVDVYLRLIHAARVVADALCA